MASEEEQLFAAAANGEAEEVKRLLWEGQAKPNWLHPHRKETPLYTACLEGHLPVVFHLLSHPKTRVQLGQPTGETPLHAACSQGHVAIVQALLGHGEVDPNAGDCGRFSPLALACFYGHVEVVQYLLRCPRVDVNKTQFLGCSPFFIACREGHARVVQELLRCPRVDINLPDKFRTSPVHVAFTQGHLDVMCWILASDRQVVLGSELLLELEERLKEDLDELELGFCRLVQSFVHHPLLVRRNLQIQLSISGFFSLSLPP